MSGNSFIREVSVRLCALSRGSSEKCLTVSEKTSQDQILIDQPNWKEPIKADTNEWENGGHTPNGFVLTWLAVTAASGASHCPPDLIEEALC